MARHFTALMAFEWHNRGISMARRIGDDRPERQGEFEVPNFQATQRDALEVQLAARDLGITPAQLRSLRLAYGNNRTKIRKAAERLRQS